MAALAVAVNNRRSGVYALSAGQRGPHPFDFRVVASGDLRVTYGAVGGSQRVLGPAEFVASGVGELAGGSIELTFDPSAGDTLVIEAAEAIDRQRDASTSTLDAGLDINTPGDKITRVLQDLRRDLGNAAVFPPSEAGLTFPPAAARAGRVAAFGPLGEIIAGPRTTDLDALGERTDAIDALSVPSRLSALDLIGADLDGADTIGDAAALLAVSAPGLLAKDGTGAPVSRALEVGDGLSVANPAGADGNPSISFDTENDAALVALGVSAVGRNLVRLGALSVPAYVLVNPDGSTAAQPTTGLGTGDTVSTANSVVSGNWQFTGSPDFSAAVIGQASREAFGVRQTVVADHAALKALAGSSYDVVEVNDPVRFGKAYWRAGDHTLDVFRDQAEVRWVAPNAPDGTPGSGSTGAWEFATSGPLCLQRAGVIPDGDAANAAANREAWSKVIAYLQTQPDNERAFQVPVGTTTVDGAVTSMLGNGWLAIGWGNQASRIKQLSDTHTLVVDNQQFDAYHLELRGLHIEGSNDGTDVNSSGIAFLGDTSSATGSAFPKISDVQISGVRYGVYFKDTGKTLWAGDDTLSQHRYLIMHGVNILPTLPVDIGLYFDGAGPADGSHVALCQFRGSVAAVAMGNGLANHSLGDTIFDACHANGIGDGTSLCWRIYGPANLNYNQLFRVDNSQCETTHETTCADIRNLDTFVFNTSHDPFKRPQFTSCVNYTYAVQGGIVTGFLQAGSLDVDRIVGPLLMEDPNGPRYIHPILGRRTVHDSYLELWGGTSSSTPGPGARFRLGGPLNGTIPNTAEFLADTVHMRANDGTLFGTFNNVTRVLTLAAGARIEATEYGIDGGQLWVDPSGNLRWQQFTRTTDTDGVIAGAAS